MKDEKIEKTVKAKIYNLKSGMDGVLQLFDSGVLAPDAVGPAITSLCVRAVDELSEFLQKEI